MNIGHIHYPVSSTTSSALNASVSVNRFKLLSLNLLLLLSLLVGVDLTSLKPVIVYDDDNDVMCTYVFLI